MALLALVTCETNTDGGSVGDDSGIVIPFTLTATQVKVTDETAATTTYKYPSHWMVFDVTPDKPQNKSYSVEFLLVKDGEPAPASPSDFQKSITISPKFKDASGNFIAQDKVVVPNYPSAIAPTCTTSVFIAYDSQERYPLAATTKYTLYVLFPENGDIKNLGTFTTGTPANLPTTNPPEVTESFANAKNSGAFYRDDGGFFVFPTLLGGHDKSGGFHMERNEVPIFADSHTITNTADYSYVEPNTDANDAAIRTWTIAMFQFEQARYALTFGLAQVAIIFTAIPAPLPPVDLPSIFSTWHKSTAHKDAVALRTTARNSATPIGTVAELANIGATGTYYLTDNTDLSSIANWTPLHNTPPFSGTLHGEGYAIYNLSIDLTTTNNVGLFSILNDATVENLAIVVRSVSG